MMLMLLSLMFFPYVGCELFLTTTKKHQVGVVVAFVVLTVTMTNAAGAGSVSALTLPLLQ